MCEELLYPWIQEACGIIWQLYSTDLEYNCHMTTEQIVVYVINATGGAFDLYSNHSTCTITIVT